MSGSGNMIPQSRTRMRPSTSMQAQFRPISPRPPRNTTRTGWGAFPPPTAGPEDVTGALFSRAFSFAVPFVLTDAFLLADPPVAPLTACFFDFPLPLGGGLSPPDPRRRPPPGARDPFPGSDRLEPRSGSANRITYRGTARGAPDSLDHVASLLVERTRGHGVGEPALPGGQAQGPASRLGRHRVGEG